MYEDGEVYDVLSGSDRYDVDFYRTLVKEYGDPVLELACGTGVLSIPIAKDGYKITGLDLSEGMLLRAKKKAEGFQNIEFVKTNMMDFNLNTKFKTIFVGFNSVCHLSSYSEIEGMLRCVKEHLDDEGIFVFDCFIPDPKYLCRDKDKFYTVIDEDSLKITENNQYDSINQINHIKWYYEYKGEKWTEDLNMRMYYPQEIQNYFFLNGFEIIKKYGDHKFGDFNCQSRFQIYVCKKNNTF